MIFIVIYELLTGRSGVAEERPLAMFRNPNEANVYVEMLLMSGRKVVARAI